MHFLAEGDIPAHVVTRPSFLEVIRLTLHVVPSYAMPHRRHFSGGREGQVVGTVGTYLTQASQIARQEKTDYISSMQVSGSITSDGARIGKRDDNQKKTYDPKDSVTLLVMVCEKMAEIQDRRNRKIIKVLQTRERSGRSQT